MNSIFAVPPPSGFAFFPANIYAAVNHVPMGGHAWGPVYLLIRAPLQAVILLWVFWFTLKLPATHKPAR